MTIGQKKSRAPCVFCLKRKVNLWYHLFITISIAFRITIAPIRKAWRLNSIMDKVLKSLEKLSIVNRVFIAIDTEGTARSGGIREIGAVFIGSDDVTFCDTVTQAGKTEGLSPADAARTWAVVGPRFVDWVQKNSPPGATIHLVGHNIIPHDRPILLADTRALCPEHLGFFEDAKYLDTLSAVYQVLPELEKRDLSSVYKHLFGGEPPRHSQHTALADARATAAVAGDGRIFAYISGFNETRRK